jgi:lactate permease
MTAMLLLTALAPLLLVLVLLLLRLGTAAAMAFSLGISAILAFSYWQMPLLQIAAASLEGVIIAGSVLWIMAGALLLLAYQRQTGQLEMIRQGFARLSPDPRLQLLWVGWFGVAFMEGIAGFGTPAAIVAPLLLTLGFTPLAAVILALLADSSPVSYGALGTPLLIGIAQGAAIQQPAELMAVAHELAWLDLLAAPVLPVMMLVIYGRLFNRQLAIWPAIPHAIVAGFGYSASALLWLQLAGPEFPAILAAISGFLLSYLYQRCWPLAYSATSDQPEVAHLALATAVATPQPGGRFLQAMAPYLVVIFLLLLTRLPWLPFKTILQSWQWHFQHLLGSDISTSLSPLYLPGSIFVLVLLLFLPTQRAPWQLLGRCWQDCWPKLSGAALTLMCAVPLVRLFVHSDINQAGLPAMPAYLATLAGQYLAEHWLACSALLGALGAFIAGSATFSNLLFAEMQLDLAQQAAISPTLVLALQMLGANAGNMICLLNIVAAASVVGLQGQERTVLKILLGPMLLYLAIATLAALMTE